MERYKMTTLIASRGELPGWDQLEEASFYTRTVLYKI